MFGFYMKKTTFPHIETPVLGTQMRKLRPLTFTGWKSLQKILFEWKNLQSKNSYYKKEVHLIWNSSRVNY